MTIEPAFTADHALGQRICAKYDDVTDTVATPDSPLPRVFIAGDACHTHSPKAGQGMNFSMQDSFNLGWKLAAVLRKQCAPELLHTYSSERQVVAQQLIDFDREWAKMFSDPAKEGGEGGVDPKEFQKYFEQHGRFTAGLPGLVTHLYSPSGASPSIHCDGPAAWLLTLSLWWCHGMDDARHPSH